MKIVTLGFSSEPNKPIKKLRKTTFKFRKDYGYSPMVTLWVQRLAPRKHFPRFMLRVEDIHSDHFEFYHEPYSKKSFIFCYQVVAVDEMSIYENGKPRVIFGNVD